MSSDAKSFLKQLPDFINNSGDVRLRELLTYRNHRDFILNRSNLNTFDLLQIVIPSERSPIYTKSVVAKAKNSLVATATTTTTLLLCVRNPINFEGSFRLKAIDMKHL